MSVAEDSEVGFIVRAAERERHHVIDGQASALGATMAVGAEVFAAVSRPYEQAVAEFRRDPPRTLGRPTRSVGDGGWGGCGFGGCGCGFGGSSLGPRPLPPALTARLPQLRVTLLEQGVETASKQLSQIAENLVQAHDLGGALHLVDEVLIRSESHVEETGLAGFDGTARPRR